METSRVDFLYLDEKDMIEAGVLNMHECINEMEKVYRIISSGDYLMGGRNDNSHGMLINFPENPVHANMPKAGPDRRFMAMPAYLGGEYGICGCKWYGSNIENVGIELPRSILMMTLNDAVTGAPLAYQSANLLSAWRTGAIPGVGVRYLANPDSKTIGIVGSGAIGTSSFEAIYDSCPSAELVKLYDVYKPTAEILKDRINKEHPQLKVSIVENLEEAIRDSDIVNLATSGNANPYVKEEWVKPGTLFTISSSADFDPEFIVNKAKVFVDNWKMYEAFKEELVYPYYSPTVGVIGLLFLDWIHDGHMTADNVKNIGDVIEGKIKGRESKDDIILFGLGGQPLYDVAWGYRVYQNALKMGIGTKLNLWDRAYQAR